LAAMKDEIGDQRLGYREQVSDRDIFEASELEGFHAVSSACETKNNGWHTTLPPNCGSTGRAGLGKVSNSQGVSDQRPSICANKFRSDRRWIYLQSLFELFSLGFRATEQSGEIGFMMREVGNRGLGRGARMVTGPR
jgi:hypothetical protein